MHHLTELLRGRGAHADPLACIEDLNPDLAQRRVAGFPHSIADLVFHMNYWMHYELRRIRGEKPHYPEHNAESFPSMPQDQDQDKDKDKDKDKAWAQLRRDFAWLLAEFAKLAASPRAELERQVESIHVADQKVASTVQAVIAQMIAHTSYHTGQIALMRRSLGAWPPKAGGDTW